MRWASRIPHWVHRWSLALRISARGAWRFRSRAWMAVVLLAIPGVVLVAVSTTLWTVSSPLALVQMWLGHDQRVQAEVDVLSTAAVTQNSVGSSHSEATIEAGDAVDVGALGATLPNEDSTVPVDVVYGATFAAAPADGSGAGSPAARATAGTVLVQTADASLPAVGIDRHSALTGGEALVPSSIMKRTGTRVGDSLRYSARLTSAATATTVAGTVRIVGSAGDDSSVVVGAGTFDLDRSRLWEQASTSWYVVGTSPVTWEDVRELNGHGFLVTSRAVVVRPPSAGELYPDEPEETPSLEGGLASLGTWPAVVILGLLLAELVVLAGPVATVSARRESRSLALLSAAGGDDRDRRRVVSAWGVVVGACAGILAIPAGLVAATLVCRVAYDVVLLLIPWPVLVLAFLVCVGLGAPVALWPAREAARMDVVAALVGRPSRASWMVLRRPGRVAVVALGFAVEAVAARGDRLPLFLLGAALVLGGLTQVMPSIMLASGGIRMGMPLAWRVAMRDAVRQGHRTFPALVAIASVAYLSSAGLVWLTTQNQTQWESAAHLGSRGQVVVTALGDGGSADATGDQDAALAVLASGPGVSSVTTVWGGSATADSDGIVQTVSAVVPPSNQCPLVAWGAGRVAARPASGPGEDRWKALAGDPRCWMMSHTLPVLDEWASADLRPSYIVDDGTYLSAAGFLRSDRDIAAIATLRSGGVLVLDPRAVVGGRATVHSLTTVSETAPGRNGEETRAVGIPDVSEDLSLPADTWQDLGVMVVSPRAARELGLRVVPIARLVTTEEPVGVLTAASVSDRLGGAVPGVSITVIQPDASTVLLPVGIMAVVVLLVVVVVAMAVALASAPSRTDLRNLHVLGASPGLIRWTTLCQGLVLVVHALPVGIVAGVLTGALAALCTLHPTSVLVSGMLPRVPVGLLVFLVLTALACSIAVVTAVVPRPGTSARGDD